MYSKHSFVYRDYVRSRYSLVGTRQVPLYQHIVQSYDVSRNEGLLFTAPYREPDEIFGPTKLFISYCYDPISLLPITAESDEPLRKYRIEYEKARVSILSQTLTDAQFSVSVDLYSSEVKTSSWAEEQLKLCDYLIIVISESYFQFICQQHAVVSPQISLPKLRTLETFVNEAPNRTLVVSFTADPVNIIPPILAETDLFHLMDMPKLTLQKNFEQLITKIRPSYDSSPQKSTEETEVEVPGIEVPTECKVSTPEPDKIGELPQAVKKKREKPKKLFTHSSELSVVSRGPRRSYNITTPLVTPEMQQTSELSIAGVKVIDLSYTDAHELPCDLPYHEGVQALWMSNNRFSNLDVLKLSHLTQLEELYIHCNTIQVYPSALCDCFSNLRILWLSSNDLKDLPDTFSNLTALRHLHLSENDFNVIPTGVLGLKGLNVLYMNHNHIADVPDEISQLEDLARLYLNDNWLESVSDNLTKMVKLKKVMMLDNYFYTFPEFVANTKLSFNLAISSVNN